MAATTHRPTPNPLATLSEGIDLPSAVELAALRARLLAVDPPKLARNLPKVRWALGRVLGLQALRRRGAEAREAAHLVLPLLEDRDEDVRRAAAGALAAIAASGDVAVRAALLPLVDDPHEAVRKEAALALHLLRPSRSGLVAASEPVAWPGEGFETRLLAPKDLVAASKLEADQLVRGLRDGRKAVRHNCAVALGLKKTKGRGGTTALILALKDSSPEVRSVAAASLAAIGARAEDAVPALLEALDGAAPLVKAAAIEALDAFEPALRYPGRALLARRPQELKRTLGRLATHRPERWVGLLATELDAESILEAENAAHLLRGIGPAAAAAVPALIETLPHAEPNQALLIIDALLAIGPPSQTLVEAFGERHLRSTSRVVREAAFEALRIVRRALQRG